MGGMIGDPGQDVGQPGLRVDVVQLGRSRPALHARKLRYLELKAGHKPLAARKEPRTPTTSKAIAIRNDAGSSRARRLTPALWQVGTQEGRRRARVPQRRSDNNRAARQDFHLVPCSLPRGHPCATAD